MADLKLKEYILNIIENNENLTVKDIQNKLAEKKIKIAIEIINSILYGELREQVNRDLNELGIPTWSKKGISFHASRGLEFKLYQRLLDKGIISISNSTMDYIIENKKLGKLYHLDIAVELYSKKFNIEIDGFEHIRADARLSIQKQIKFKGMNADIEIDWMDNSKSYVDFKEIDNRLVFKWCNSNLDWCRLYHEELIWPDDISRNIFLIENGWKVMRLWNEEIRKDLNDCVNLIEDWIYR